jgi:hypothetical protein
VAKSIHPNSVAAYWQGRLDLFGKRHQQVLRALRAARGPLTDREVMIALGFGEPNAVRPRITELIDAGVLVEVDSVECPMTRKRVRRVKAATRSVHAEFALEEVLTPAVRAKIA